MKQIFIFIGICLLLGTIFYYRSHPLSATITIRGVVYPIELAITSKEWEKGLAGRTSLPPGHGMLFIRDHKEQYQFWMAGMEFPLDFVWLDGNRIVEITKNVSVKTDGSITTVKPNIPVDKILELNAGEVEMAGIQVGDIALFNK